MADGRYGKLRVYKDGSWQQPSEVQVYTERGWQTFGANLDKNNTNSMKVFQTKTNPIEVLQRYYTYTEDSGAPYIQTKSTSSLYTVNRNGDLTWDDEGFQWGNYSWVYCKVSRSSNRSTTIYESISRLTQWSSWANRTMKDCVWGVGIYWNTNGTISVRIKYGNANKVPTGDNTYTSNMKCTDVNKDVTIKVGMEMVSSGYTGYLYVEINGQREYLNGKKAVSQSLEGTMKAYVNPTGDLKIKYFQVRYRLYQSDDRYSAVDAEKTSGDNAASRHIDMTRKQDSVTIGYWQ